MPFIIILHLRKAECVCSYVGKMGLIAWSQFTMRNCLNAFDLPWHFNRIYVIGIIFCLHNYKSKLEWPASEIWNRLFLNACVCVCVICVPRCEHCFFFFYNFWLIHSQLERGLNWLVYRYVPIWSIAIFVTRQNQIISIINWIYQCLWWHTHNTDNNERIRSKGPTNLRARVLCVRNLRLKHTVVVYSYAMNWRLNEHWTIIMHVNANAWRRPEIIYFPWYVFVPFIHIQRCPD